MLHKINSKYKIFCLKNKVLFFIMIETISNAIKEVQMFKKTIQAHFNQDAPFENTYEKLL